MSLVKVEIGPFSGIYVGNFVAVNPVSSTDVLTEGYEDQYFAGVNEQLQVGPFITSIPFTFLDSTDIIVQNLSRGLSIHNANINTPPENNFYTLLLIHPDSASQNSVLIDRVRTKRDKRVSRSKAAASSIVVNFTAEDRSRYPGSQVSAIGAVTYGTPLELAVILGSRSPL